MERVYKTIYGGKTMKRKTYTIYNNYNVCSDENMKEAKNNLIENMFFDEDENGLITVTDNYGKEIKLTREEYSNSLTDEKIYNECYAMDSLWFSDSLEQLEEVDTEDDIIAIANIGTWRGNFSGYKEIKELKNVLYSSCDYETIYVDSNGDLRKNESHHDGNNSILYRYWKDNLTQQQKENFLNKIYNGEATQKDITRYTKKAGLAIARYFGWNVRGSKVKIA